MVSAEQEDLIIRCAGEQVAHKQHVLRIFQFRNCFLDLCAQVIRRLAVVESNRNHIICFTENHACRGIDTCRKVTMTCKDNPYHYKNSLLCYFFHIAFRKQCGI